MSVKIKSLALAVALASAAGAVQAVTVSSQFFSGFQQLSDNSAEFLINANGATDTTLDVGDRLQGIFNVQTIEAGGVTHNLGVGSVDELTGIFDIIVTSKIEVPIPSSSLFFYTFAASGALDSLANGAAIALFDDPAQNFVREGVDLATAIASATGGDLWAVLGLGTNGFWLAQTSTDDVAVVRDIAAPGNGGTFNVGLNLLVNNTGLQFQNVPCNLNPQTIEQVFTCGSGSILGTGGVVTPFDIFDNVDFAVNRVPEPGTMALLGLGLLGLGALRRRHA